MSIVSNRSILDVSRGLTLTPQRYLMELKGLQQLEAPGAPPQRVRAAEGIDVNRPEEGRALT